MLHYHPPSEPPKVLENFALLQKLPHKASALKIISSNDIETLAIWEQRSNNAILYTWQPDKQLFALNSSKLCSFICK